MNILEAKKEKKRESKNEFKVAAEYFFSAFSDLNFIFIPKSKWNFPNLHYEKK